jgi:transcription factor SPN1
MDNEEKVQADSPEYSPLGKNSESNVDINNLSVEAEDKNDVEGEKPESIEEDKEGAKVSVGSPSDKDNGNDEALIEDEQSGKVEDMTYDKEEDGEAGSDDENRRKHKKKRRSKKHSKHDRIRKKLKTETEGGSMLEDDQEGILDSEEDEEDEGATEGKKKKKNKEKKAAKSKAKKTKKEMEAEYSQSEATNIKGRMEEAFRLDLDCIERKQPALNKLRLLPEIEKALRKEYILGNFLDNDGLDVIEKWLRKLPDGSFPSQTLKKKMLELIQYLPVEEDHLKESKLGRLLFEMQRAPNEDAATKKIVKEIITKWSRILLEIPPDFSYRREADAERESTVQKIKVNINDEARERGNSKGPAPVNPNTVRYKSGYDFAKRPQQIDLNKLIKSDKNTHTEEFERALVDIKKKMKLGSRKL